MALIFPRLANNFIKNGYYPTDQITLSRIVLALGCQGPTARIFDPTCAQARDGAGDAAKLGHDLGALRHCGQVEQRQGQPRRALRHAMRKHWPTA